MVINMKNERTKRKRIIPDKIFSKLWRGAEKEDDKKEYIRKYSSVSSENYTNLKLIGLEYEEGLYLLSEIYDKQKMEFKTILEAAGKRKSDISTTFCIPIRTVEEWYNGKNKCASYIRLMLLKHYHLLNLGKYIYMENEEEYERSKPAVYKK